MMKKLLPLLFLLPFAGLTSKDYSCFGRHQHLKVSQYKTGEEAKRSDTVDVIDYAVYLDFTQMTSSQLSGFCQVKFEAKMNISSISLDLLQMTVDSIKMGSNLLTYSYNDTLIVAQLPSAMSMGQTDSLTVYYQGSPQTDPSGWGGFYFSGAYAYNLGVGFEAIPHNFGRVWHPCFDNFIERATYHFSVLTNDGNTAYCNGIRESVTTVGTDSLLTVWSMTDAIPSYLAGVSVSQYTHVELNYFSSLQGINIPIWLVSQESDTTNFKSSFINLNSALEAFENRYGPYVWDRVGYVTVPFNAGAMEHATHIAYPLVVINGSTAYETLMAHELSHHWWGDWVTTESAEEMWINEGMAVYSEHLFTEWLYGYADYMDAVRDNHYHCLHRAHIDDGGHYALNAVPLQYTYGEHSYHKAADVMHSLRSVMGDASFFTGLQYIQTNFGNGNINSTEFMQALNTATSVDITDFFNGWIFQPGYSHFSVSDFTVTPTAGLYNVQVVINQKLKGAATYHDNVPLELTFMDANWNRHLEMVSMSGDWEAISVQIPINPVFVGVNLHERINDATTAISDTVTTMGNKLYDYANVRFTCTSLTDSIMLRIEHNWVWADVYNVPANIEISKDRYWNVHGVDLNKADGELRFEFDGRSGPNYDFDPTLMVNVGGQNFKEDSLVLLYRPDATSDWTIHPNYEINHIGSKTDKHGYLTALSFAPGQYAFGYRVHSVGVDNSYVEPTYSIYPNPASDSLIIDLSSWKPGKFTAEFYAINGQFMQRDVLNGNAKNSLNIRNLEKGMYILVIKDESGSVLGTKRVVVN